MSKQRSKREPGRPTLNLSARVDAQIHTDVTALATRCGMSLNLFMEELLKHELRTLGPDGRPEWLTATPPAQEELDVTTT